MAALLLSLTGCSYTTSRFHPDYAVYRPAISRLLVMQPQVVVFEELADGSHLFRQEAVSRAEADLRQVLADVLAGEFAVQPADGVAMPEDQAKEVQALFRNVNRSIQLHTYGPQIFPLKQDAFEYSLGNVSDLLAASGSDALVLTIGHQTISQSHPKTWVSIAVAEPGGRIVWYGMQGAKTVIDISDTRALSELVQQTVSSLLEGRS